MTSLNAYRTVITPRLKRMDPPREIPRPKLSMAEDAKQCNRLGTWAQNKWCPIAADPAEKPPSKGREGPDWAARETALMEAMPGTALQLAKRTGLSGDIARESLHRLRVHGKVTTRKAGHNLLIWEVLE